MSIICEVLSAPCRVECQGNFFRAFHTVNGSFFAAENALVTFGLKHRCRYAKYRNKQTAKISLLFLITINIFLPLHIIITRLQYYYCFCRILVYIKVRIIISYAGRMALIPFRIDKLLALNFVAI